MNSKGVPPRRRVACKEEFSYSFTYDKRKTSMERRDYIQRHIEQLGQVLAKMWERLLNSPRAEEPADVVHKIATQLCEQLGSDFTDALAPNRLAQSLEKGELSDERVDTIVEVLLQQAELLEGTSDSELQRELLSIALSLCEYRAKTNLAYSLDKHFLLQKLRHRVLPRAVSRSTGLP